MASHGSISGRDEQGKIFAREAATNLSAVPESVSSGQEAGSLPRLSIQKFWDGCMGLEGSLSELGGGGLNEAHPFVPSRGCDVADAGDAAGKRQSSYFQGVSDGGMIKEPGLFVLLDESTLLEVKCQTTVAISLKKIRAFFRIRRSQTIGFDLGFFIQEIL